MLLVLEPDSEEDKASAADQRAESDGEGTTLLEGQVLEHLKKKIIVSALELNKDMGGKRRKIRKF